MGASSGKRRWTRAWIGGVAFVGLSMVMAGCGSSSDDGGSDAESPIKIGVTFSLTGPIAFAGVEELGGTKLAAAAINDAGGILGRQVELVITDDTSTPDQAVLNIRKLVQQDEVVAIIGPGSSNATVVGAQTAEDLQVPLVALPSTVGDIWEGPDLVKWGFGTAGDGSALGYGCIADIVEAEEALGNSINTLAIGNEDYPGALASVEGIKSYAAEHGIEIVASEQWLGDVTELTGVTSKLLASEPDLVTVSGAQTSTVLAIKALDQLGALGSMPVGSCSSPNLESLFEGLGSSTASKDRLYLMTLGGDVYPLGVKTGTPNDETRQALLDAQEKYGEDLSGIDSISSFSSAGWDALHIIKQAIEKANSTDGAAIRDAIESGTWVGGQVTSAYSPTQHRSAYDDYQKAVVVTSFNADGTLRKP